MKYLVAIHLPDNFDGYGDDQENAVRDIDALNAEMEAAGARFFAGGLLGVNTAKALRSHNGKVIVTDGPYLETKEHIGGFWILDCANEEEALEWGRKAVIACRAPVEVRGFGRNNAD